MPPTARPHAETTRYSDIRDHFVLVRHDPSEGAVRVLLRVDGAERPATRDKLRELGFIAATAPLGSPVSLKRPVVPDQVAAAYESVREALGDEALLDLGTVEHGVAPALDEVPKAWGGRFLVHVGGTRRCVVFDTATNAGELARVIDDAEEAYWANDFHPATE